MVVTNGHAKNRKAMLKKRPRNVMDWQKCTINTPGAQKNLLVTVLEKKLADDKAYKETLWKEAKCSQNHLANRIAGEENEINFVDRLENIREEFHKRKCEILQKKEAILAQESEKQRKLLEEKRRLQLLQNSEEFQEFERHIQRARVAKQQALQIMSKENSLKLAKEAEADEIRRLNSERELFTIVEEQRMHMKNMQQRHIQNTLLEQMDKKRGQEEEAVWLEKERGRRDADEIIKELQAERKLALEKRCDRQREVLQTYEDYWNLQDKLKASERLRHEMDGQRIQEFIKQKEHRGKMWQDSQNTHLNQINDMKEKLGNLLLEERQSRDQSENERMRLRELKYQQEQEKQEQSELAVESRRRYLAKDAVNQQYRLREAQLFREMAEEEKYRYAQIANLAKCAVSEKQANRQKQMEHVRQLKNMMEEVKARSYDDKLANAMFVKQVEESHKMNRMAIQTEKLKVLKDEMTELWGHLPKVRRATSQQLSGTDFMSFAHVSPAEK